MPLDEKNCYARDLGEDQTQRESYLKLRLTDYGKKISLESNLESRFNELAGRCSLSIVDGEVMMRPDDWFGVIFVMNMIQPQKQSSWSGTPKEDQKLESEKKAKRVGGLIRKFIRHQIVVDA